MKELIRKYGILFIGIVILVFLFMSAIEQGKMQEYLLLDDSLPLFTGINEEALVTDGFHPEKDTVDMLKENGYEQFADTIQCSFDKKENLENGDTISYACTYDRQLAQKNHIRIKQDTKQYTVTDLPLFYDLDLFENVIVRWNIDEKEIYPEISVPQKQKDLLISYMYEDGSFDGENIRIKATYDIDLLHEKKYDVSMENTIAYPIGPKPVKISSLEELDEEQTQSVHQQAEDLFLKELLSCDFMATFHGDDIHIDKVNPPVIKQSFFDNETFTIVFSLDVADQDDWFSIFRSFDSSYRGAIYKYPDGSVQFFSKTKHACRFEGFLGFYELATETAW